MKLASRLLEGIREFNQDWGKVNAMFTRPMVELKKLIKFESKEISPELKKQLEQKTKLIDDTLKEINELIDNEMYKK